MSSPVPDPTQPAMSSDEIQKGPEEEAEEDEDLDEVPERAHTWVLLEFFLYSVSLFVFPLIVYYSCLSFCAKYLTPLKPDEAWNRDLILSAGASTCTVWIILGGYAYRAYCESVREANKAKKRR